MTPEAQRIAIAEACGWGMFDHAQRIVSDDHGNAISSYRDITGCNGTNTFFVPDYLNDLNAMHEAEKVLTVGQHLEYDHHLTAICGTMDYNATAAQRAEAFLRTLGEWTE